MEAREYNLNYGQVDVNRKRVKRKRKVRISENKKIKVRSKKYTKSINRAKSKTVTKSKKIVLSFLCLINIFFIGITFSGYISMSNTSIQMSKLKQEISELETIRDDYKMKIGKLTSSERIEEIAKYSLGMSYPDDTQYYYLSNNNREEKTEDNKEAIKDSEIAKVNEGTIYEE